MRTTLGIVMPCCSVCSRGRIKCLTPAHQVQEVGKKNEKMCASASERMVIAHSFCAFSKCVSDPVETHLARQNTG
ncbi:hypothetical protein Rcae01_05816 [Novipirellula caenicola]|uniref:Secreted protein n=1 Tax=Novipirellula caenicola TaxID=1536901 RepID=A0ABP9W321_9BACT